MSWFDKWVMRKAEKLAINQMSIVKSSMAGITASPQSLGHRLESSGLRFNLYKATGGFVVETQSYDARTDRHQTHLYVVSGEQDIGKEIGKIITLEALKS